MFERLLTEQFHPAWTSGQAPSLGAVLTAMNQSDAQVPAAVSLQLPQIEKLVHAVAAALDCGGSLIYVGAGSSGRLGVLDAAECPPTFHTPPHLVRAIIAGGDAALRRSVEGAEDDPEAGVRDLIASGITSADAVVGLSSSGRTPYVIAAVTHARDLGAITACICCTPDSELARVVQFPIQALVGPEIVAGSTRLRAGTATKLILNMLTTATMIQLGYTYGGLMINVQPTNKKLEDRARRIIERLAAVSCDRAGLLLEQAGGSVPVAILMEKKHLGRPEAERMLAQARGRLALVLENEDPE